MKCARPNVAWAHAIKRVSVTDSGSWLTQETGTDRTHRCAPGAVAERGGKGFQGWGLALRKPRIESPTVLEVFRTGLPVAKLEREFRLSAAFSTTWQGITSRWRISVIERAMVGGMGGMKTPCLSAPLIRGAGRLVHLRCPWWQRNWP